MTHEGKLLKEILKDRGENLSDFAGKIGMSRQNLYLVFGREKIDASLKEMLIKQGIDLTNVKENGQGHSKSNAVLLNNADLKIMEVPLVNQYAYAGYLHGFADAEFVEHLPKMPWLVNREYRGYYLTFEVRGDSMDDNTRESYIEGDLLLCREISRDKWATSKLHIKKWDFVIVHKNEGILIKRILDHNVEKGIIRLHSLNDLYEDFDINLKDVAQIFNVVQVSRKK